jgi:hypothetical protein
MKTIYKHKYMEAICEILEDTKKGYKTLFCELGKKPKIVYFYKIDFDKDKGLFIKIEGDSNN